MQEVQKDIESWLDRGMKAALVQVIHTWGPSPRRTGSVMAVASDGSLSGSVSGGCLEGQVIREALLCLEEGVRGVPSYKASSDGALEAVLTCGGGMEAVISMLQPSLFYAEREELRRGNEYVRVTLAEPGKEEGLSGLDFLMVHAPGEGDGPCGAGTDPGEWRLIPGRRGEGYEEIRREAAGRIAERLKARESCCGGSDARSEVRPEVTAKGRRFFFHYVKPRPRLICIGGVHIAVHLTRMARELGYRTVVIDPRGVFSAKERFPFADELWKEWPQQALEHVPLDRMTALCALSHDPKLDVPAMARALRAQAFYIGCLGRTTTQLDRFEALREEGFTEEEIGRIYGPVGLNLGGREPAEIALSILSQITMVRYGGRLPARTMKESARAGAAEREKQPGQKDG